MNDVHARLVMRKIYETECINCKCDSNNVGYPCGSGRKYRYKGRGFNLHELRNGTCDGYVRKESTK